MPIKKPSKKLSIWDRLKAETPKFWRKIGILGGSLLAIGVSLQVVIDKYKINWFPDHVPGYLIIAGTVMATLAPLVVEPKQTISNANDDEL